jgi:hypothetical protein
MEPSVRIHRFSFIPIFGGLLATVVACGPETGVDGDAAWSLNASGLAATPNHRCGLTFSKPNDFTSAFITIEALGGGLSLLVKQAGMPYPEGPGVAYKMVWIGAPGPLEINMRPTAHAFLMAPINFQTDPAGRLSRLLQAPSTLTMATNASAQVFIVKLPPVPRALGLRQASCLSEANDDDSGYGYPHLPR